MGLLSQSIKFFGFCERYQEVQKFVVPFENNFIPINRKDLIGLSDISGSHVFPTSIPFWVLGIDFEMVKHLNHIKYTLRYKNSRKETLGEKYIDITPYSYGEGEIDLSNYFLAVIPTNDIWLDIPGVYYIYAIEDNKETLIGSFNTFHIPAQELTSSAIEAIKSNPFARKSVRLEIKYKTGEFIKAYAGIDNKKKKDMDDYVWYKDLPDEFKFEDGKIIDLHYIKENLHGLLGGPIEQNGNIESFDRYYSQSALIKLYTEFKKLIDDNLSEEHYQNFIEKNPILLSFLSPKLLSYKSPIGSKYVTDITILNSQNQLVLIELQTPNIELFTNSGQINHKLQKEIDQVQNWLDEVEKDRYGTIRNLNIAGLNQDLVSKVKGIVICGRRKEEELKYHHKLNRFQSIEIYNYDDLLDNLLSVAQKLIEFK